MYKLISKKPTYYFNSNTYPIFLLIITFLAYGPLVLSLGYYWDDWPMIWFANTTGPGGMFSVLEGDRPFLAGIYWVTTSLLGNNPLEWQLLGIICRWLLGVTVWWALLELWPNHKLQVSWIALLVVIYPGFKQQPISVIYSNGLILLILLMLSFGLTVKSLRNRSQFSILTALSVVCFTICTFSTEYYIGLEITRGLFIFSFIKRFNVPIKSQLLFTLKKWSPFLLIMGIWFIWRVLIFGFPTYEPELVKSIDDSQTHLVLNLVFTMMTDVLTSGWLAWSSTIRYPFISEFSITSTSIFWVVFIISIFVFSAYFWKYRPFRFLQKTYSEQQYNFPKESIMIGLFSMIFSGWPFWITNLPVTLIFPFDRFTLAFMLGGCITLIGLIEWLFRTGFQKIAIICLITAMAIGNHLLNANSYRKDWVTFSDLFWQLSYRVPGLKPGTLILTEELPMQYYSDNSLTAPLNWMYEPDYDGLSPMPYFFAFSGVRVGRSIPELKKNLPVEQRYRNKQFVGTTSDMLVLFYSQPGCLRILDPIRDRDLYIFPDAIQKMASLSNLEMIIPNKDPAAVPMKEIIQSEPPNNWCYYYQKAELARQVEDWEEIERLGNVAYSIGTFPQEASELMTFIEGYAAVGNWQRAFELSDESYRMSPMMQGPICNLFMNLENRFPHSKTQLELLNSYMNKLDCPE